MSVADDRKTYRGPALLTFGFRPFFLAAAIWAALAAPLWVWMHLGGSGMGVHREWHVHEMLFGFVAAAVAGFLTTAVPNWTGRKPITGVPLGLLVSLWLAGRLAMLLQFAIGPVAIIIDCAFLLVFAAVISHEVLSGGSWRNLPVCGLVTAFAVANLAFHLNGLFGYSDFGARLAIAAVILLLSLIGGRIVPNFTRNWLKARQAVAQPEPFGHVDRAALAITGVGAAAWVVTPDAVFTGWTLLGASVLSLVRLSRWRGWLTAREPLLWILHAGFGWLALGLALLGGTALTDLIPRTAGVHAVTAGAMGVMILAVMTRATRGHTGRPLSADRSTLAIYLSILAAAALRVAAPFLSGIEAGLLIASAALWSLAFAGYAAAYGPMLLKPRLGKA